MAEAALGSDDPMLAHQLFSVYNLLLKHLHKNLQGYWLMNQDSRSVILLMHEKDPVPVDKMGLMWPVSCHYQKVYYPW